MAKAKTKKKCGPCSPLTIARSEFTKARAEAKKAGSCAPLDAALERIKPLIQAEADLHPKRRHLLHREILAKAQTAQNECRKVKSSASYWAGFEGVKGRKTRRKRR